MSLLLEIAHSISDNRLYRECIRRRQALVLRRYDGRHYGYQHAAQQRFWEWWLDRFESTQWHLGSLDSYLQLRVEDVQGLLALARYIGAARQMKDLPDDETS